MSNKINVALELSSSAIKIVVGYKLDDQVIVLYANKHLLPLNAIVGEEIKDSDLVVSTITEAIKEAQKNLKSDIKDVILVLPPIGFEVFENTQSTNVVSSSGVIAEVDIRNVMSMLRKDRYDHNNKIVDIIPQNYYLDQNRIFANSPLGETSTTLQMNALIHTISPRVIFDFTQAVKKVGLNITKYVMAPYGVGDLLAKRKDLPNQYLLVDYGEEYTTVATINNGMPYGAIFSPNGAERLTSCIANGLNVSLEDAKYLKETYGLDQRVSTFHPIIATSTNELGQKIEYTIEDLNNIVEGYLLDYTCDLRRMFKTILREENNEIRFPLVFVGGGTRLNGFKEYMTIQKLNDDLYFPELKNLGARDITYINCLGALKVGATIVFDEEKDTTKVSPLTREKKKQKYSETEDHL